LGALEVYFRLTGVGGGFYEPDPILGARLLPNGSGRWRRACFDVPIQISSQGLRDVEHLAEKPPGLRRIAVFGDSIAEALQVPLEESFPRRLESILNAERKPPGAEVINFGISGYGTAQEFLQLKTRAAAFGPDIVVLTFTILNDVRNNSPVLEGRVSSFPRPFFRLDASGRLVALPFTMARPDTAGLVGKIKTALRHLRTYDELVAAVRARPSLRSFLASLGLLQELAPVHQAEAGGTPPASPGDSTYLDFEVYRREPDPEWKEAWQVTEALVLAMRDEAAQRGARFLLVPIPGAVELASGEAIVRDFPGYRPETYDLAGPRDRLRRLAETEGIVYVPLFEALAGDMRTRQGKVEDYFWWCDGHFTPRAHDLVARAIAEGVRALEQGDGQSGSVATRRSAN
jgi:lysophospholipase L1-like esterase